MKNKKMLSTLLSVAMVMPTAFPCGTSAEGETDIAVLPVNSAENVSVIDDVEITGIVDVSGITVEGTTVPYEVIKTATGAKVIFADELAYGSKITVKNGSEVLTSFETEQNPITTLFYEDFDGDAATSLARFEDVGTTETNFYEIYDGRLLMKTHEERQPNGGTPSGRIIDNDILYIKGSENWGDYTLDVDVANGWYTRPADNGEYYDVEAMLSVKTDKATGTGVASISRWLNPGKDSYSTMFAMDNFGATGSYHGGWNIFDSQYRTLHHMTIDAIGTDVSFKFTGYGADKSNKWTGAVAEGTKGGVTLRASWGRIVYDNVLVTDKTLVFTPSDIKNVGDTLKLTFNKAIAGTDKITVSDENGVVEAPMSLSADGKIVAIDTSALNSMSKYTVTTAADLTAVDGTVATNEKKFEFKTDSDFKILSTNISDDFSVIDDIELTFTSAVDENTAKEITVTGDAVPAYDVIVKENLVKIVFAEELAYNSEFAVVVPITVSDKNGFIMNAAEKYNLKTERNPITTLFYEDFNGDAASALARFEDVGTSETDLYEIYDGRLLMKTHEERQSNGGTPGRRTIDNNILYIKGSENWGDYTLDVDVANGWYTRPTENAEGYDVEAMMSVKTDKTTGNGVTLLGRWLNPGTDSFFTIYGLENFGVTGSYHGGWNIFNSQYRTLHHMTIDAIGTDVSFKFTGYGADKANKWTGAVAEGTRGGVTLRASWGRIVYDNVLVTDKAITFTPSALKNIVDSFDITFNRAIAESELSKISVLNGDEVVSVPMSLSADGMVVTVDVSSLRGLSEYSLKTAADLTGVDGVSANGEKTISFKTGSSFKITDCSIENGAKDVSVIDDIEIAFENEINEKTLDGIKVTGNNIPYYEVEAMGNKVNIVFEDALPYNETITVTVAGTVESIDGIVLGTPQVFAFTTERNPITTLYHQDFDDITTSGSGADMSGNKFGGLTVQSANNGTYFSNYKVENGELFMNLHWAYKGSDIGNLRFLIDGSENWTDYETSADFKQNVKDGEKWVWSGFGLRYNRENSNNSMKVFLNYLQNSGSNPRISFNYINGEGTAKEYGWNTCTLNTNEWYRLTATVEGQKVTGKVEKDGVKIREVSYDMASETGTDEPLNEKGGIYIGQFWYQSYVDNILVEDKGLIFTPAQSKYTDGKIELKFNEELTNEEAALADLITVTNQNGEEKKINVVYGTNNKNVTIDILDAMHGEVYTITVDKAVVSAEHTSGMNTNKTFKLKCDVPYSISGLEITDVDGEFKANATVNVIDTSVEDEFTLIVVVYDADGAMVDFKKDYEKVTSGKVIELSTDGIAIENGYTASAFIWNNIDEMKALSGKVTK